MLQYLTIILDDRSVSFCHYDVSSRQPSLISLDYLKKGLIFAMKENLMVQYVYPDYDIPDEMKEIIEAVDHVKIVPICSPLSHKADVVVINGISELKEADFFGNSVCVLRIRKGELLRYYECVMAVATKVARLNICITDVYNFTDKELSQYKKVLNEISKAVVVELQRDSRMQINILTDRLHLLEMNNCNAGVKSITLAPNGRFYVCPAFYYEKNCEGNVKYGKSFKHPFSVGDLDEGLYIGNAQLYKLENAPICRICDAFQCQRCVWLNWKMTNEVNTPSREQCIISHLERNASRCILNAVRSENPNYLSQQNIPEIDYLDPFDICHK